MTGDLSSLFFSSVLTLLATLPFLFPFPHSTLPPFLDQAVRVARLLYSRSTQPCCPSLSVSPSLAGHGRLGQRTRKSLVAGTLTGAVPMSIMTGVVWLGMTGTVWTGVMQNNIWHNEH